MDTGHYISGAGHLALIGWALFGGMFMPEDLPSPVTEVSMISPEEFAALTQGVEAPIAAPEIVEPEAPAVDPEGDPTPPSPEPEAQPEPAPQPAETPPPDAPDAPPEVLPDPVPPAAVQDVPPEQTQPSEDVAVVLPERTPRPQPRPAPRVAPEAVVQPDPQPDTAPEVQPETTPDEAPEDPQPEQDQAAPEEATTEIVTEAEEPSGAPEQSARPRARPQRTAAAPEPTPAPTPTPEPQADTADDPLAAALAEATSGNGSGETGRVAAGPPLSRGEREALRLAVQACWVVDVGSQAANVTVVLGMDMNRDGTVAGAIRMVSATGGDQGAQETAFQAARRAVLRCQQGGYDLPADKYDQWREIEMTFNPESMRLR